MSRVSDEIAEQAGREVTDALRPALEQLFSQRQQDAESAWDAGQVAELVTLARGAVLLEARIRLRGTTAVGERIGPVYAVADLQRWLTPPGAPELSQEAVRKRVKQRQLVAFLTDDRHWAFPAWQFDRVAGQLLVRRDVVELWRRLPHEGFLTDADLAVWMATRLRSLGGTPAEHAASAGPDSEPLQAAVSRLTARAA